MKAADSEYLLSLRELRRGPGHGLKIWNNVWPRRHFAAMPMRNLAMPSTRCFVEDILVYIISFSVTHMMCAGAIWPSDLVVTERHNTSKTA